MTSPLWVPSHCGIYYNDKVDRLAKNGARKSGNVTQINLAYSSHELNSIATRYIYAELKSANEIRINNYNDIIKQTTSFSVSNMNTKNRFLKQLAYRWKLNAFKTKYSQHGKCICNEPITREHILACIQLKQYLPSLSEVSLNTVFTCRNLICTFFKDLLESPIGSLL